MTDEKKPADTSAADADPGNQAPDELRRKLAKAALVAPVIMTFSSRSALGAACTTDTFSVAWYSASNGAALVSAGRADAAEVEQCFNCVKEYENEADARSICLSNEPSGPIDEPLILDSKKPKKNVKP